MAFADLHEIGEMFESLSRFEPSAAHHVIRRSSRGAAATRPRMDVVYDMALERFAAMRAPVTLSTSPDIGKPITLPRATPARALDGQPHCDTWEARRTASERRYADERKAKARAREAWLVEQRKGRKAALAARRTA